MSYTTRGLDNVVNEPTANRASAAREFIDEYTEAQSKLMAFHGRLRELNEQICATHDVVDGFLQRCGMAPNPPKEVETTAPGRVGHLGMIEDTLDSIGLVMGRLSITANHLVKIG